MLGGKSAGNHLLSNRAGNILIEGGESKGQGFGGSIMIKSGRGSLSGFLKLQTLDSDHMKQDSGAMVRMNHACKFFFACQSANFDITDTLSTDSEFTVAKFPRA